MGHGEFLVNSTNEYRAIDDSIPLSLRNVEFNVTWLGYENSMDPDEPSTSWEPWNNLKKCEDMQIFLTEDDNGKVLQRTLKIKT